MSAYTNEYMNEYIILEITLKIKDVEIFLPKYWQKVKSFALVMKIVTKFSLSPSEKKFIDKVVLSKEYLSLSPRCLFKTFNK